MKYPQPWEVGVRNQHWLRTTGQKQHGSGRKVPSGLRIHPVSKRNFLRLTSCREQGEGLKRLGSLTLSGHCRIRTNLSPRSCWRMARTIACSMEESAWKTWKQIDTRKHSSKTRKPLPFPLPNYYPFHTLCRSQVQIGSDHSRLRVSLWEEPENSFTSWRCSLFLQHTVQTCNSLYLVWYSPLCAVNVFGSCLGLSQSRIE